MGGLWRDLGVNGGAQGFSVQGVGRSGDPVGVLKVLELAGVGIPRYYLLLKKRGLCTLFGNLVVRASKQR